MSKLKVFWYVIRGKFVDLADYGLTLLKERVAGLADPTKDKIRATLNFALKVLSVLTVVKVFIPVKWQAAYALTVLAVEKVVSALQDLEVTKEELAGVIAGYNEAYAAWMSPDDESCVDMVKAPDGTFVVKS
jgi:hypothetical protein